MKRKELFGDDARPDSFANFTIANAQQRMIDLTGSSVPTTSNTILEEGEIGFRPADTRVYFRQLGKVYYIATTEST